MRELTPELRETYEQHLLVAKARLSQVLRYEDDHWSDDKATPVVTEAARLLSLAPGVLNGYMEVWVEVFDVMECERVLGLRGENWAFVAPEGEAR